MIKTPMKCCLSCVFCFGGRPKMSVSGGKINVKTPKTLSCHAGRTKNNWIVVQYDQPVCRQYRERPVGDV